MAFKIAYVILSYLLGSVCFGYIFAKALGKKDFGKKDLPGGSGSYRQLGKTIGLTIGFLDTLKGVAVPLLATKLLGLDIYTTVLASLAVVIGHNWPVFFRFRGGGGLSVTLGVSVVLIPIECAIAFAVAVIGGYIYKYTLGKRFKISPMPVGGGIGTLLLPVLAFAFGKPLPIVLLFVALFLIAAVKGIILTKIYK
jgi:acyl-phosphate glycerol 3-phosphate acyltransferase